MNVEPLFQFVFEDRYLRRNPFVPSPSSRRHLTEPSLAPPVFPTSRTVARFNDLYDVDRFTSACRPIIFRDETLGADVRGTAFICEPVHNLVSRILFAQRGIVFSGSRHPAEQSSEFLSSTDNWCRPSWLATGPDGALWMADMYRHVIEHPEWIPESWQASLDLYAGHDKGRIYRIYRTDTPHTPLTPIPDLTRLSSVDLVAQFEHPNGWRRDVAAQQIIERGDDAVVPVLQEMVTKSAGPRARLHALTTLAATDHLSPELLLRVLHDVNPHVVRWGITLCEDRTDITQEVASRLAELVDHDDIRVRFQLALTLGSLGDGGNLDDDRRVREALQALASRDPKNAWMRAAIVSSARGHASEMLQAMLADSDSVGSYRELLMDLIATALGDDVDAEVLNVVRAIAGPAGGSEVAD